MSVLPLTHPLREKMNVVYRQDEDEVVNHLLEAASLSPAQLAVIAKDAKHIVEIVRTEESKRSGIDSFMHEYDLSSEEGIALMCLAEAMLRIPDSMTVDKLIKEKIGDTDWKARMGQSKSWTINAATWALMLTGKVLRPEDSHNRVTSALNNFFTRTGEPVIRTAVAQAMKIMSKQFVMGRSIDEAMKRAKENEKLGYRYSYDMLGEAARTAYDAERYFNAYKEAIINIGKGATANNLDDNPGISVKLSALHPRYEFSQAERVIKEVTPKLLELAQLAKEFNIGFTVDAEEADRLDLSLDIIAKVFADNSLDDWEGFGLALQSYQKRAFWLIDYLADLSKTVGRRLKVRLIKGAYWDTEIKLAQLNGLSGFPVFTRKSSTDVSFIACAKKLISYHEYLYPQFATHNGYSVAVILELMKDHTDYEFQCLHGMGQSLYNEIVVKRKIPCRIYAPVGSHEDLLPYLVRRLLENGANTSFVNRLGDEAADIDTLIEDPVASISKLDSKPHPKIPHPKHIYAESRPNSMGLDMSDRLAAQDLVQHVDNARKKVMNDTLEEPVYSPVYNDYVVGYYQKTDPQSVKAIVEKSSAAYKTWNKKSFHERADTLDNIADLYDAHLKDLVAVLVNEAGKTYQDAISEVREASDFCRYYAIRARKDFNTVSFEGYTGETDELIYSGRGVFACISPWNFPLAIFTGQVVAALVTGNTVVAKPAEQTPLIAMRAVELMKEAGIDNDAIQLVFGLGETVGDQLVRHPAIAGVMFTGSTQTAQIINKVLADKKGPIVPFIAETGGVNAMIADSSALPEQLIMDAVGSAFGSAGQRCSALRVLFVQDDVADKVINMLKGAVEELVVGDPALFETDLGPVIDKDAQAVINNHISTLSKQAKLLVKVDAPRHLNGTFVSPHAFELNLDEDMPPEVFGPVLHVYRYKNHELDRVIDKINATGYGLTLGIHSRVSETVQYILDNTHAGNQYVNRDMIGAVVGLQPFGGEGLSGTGPKAGGPNYLRRLVAEKTVTVNTTAAGGNASLMALDEC